MTRARLLALAVASCALLAACRPHRPDPSAPAAPSRPQATLHGVRMRVFRGAELAMLGRAARLSFHRGTRDVAAEEVLLQLHPGAGPMELRAPLLRGNLDTRGADLSGGVRLQSPAGLTGETERAHFDGPSMVARGDRPVSLRGPGYALDAAAFQMDFTRETFDFEGGVTTDLQGARP